MFALALVIIVGSIDAKLAEPSINDNALFSQSLDPFLDPYVKSITQMNVHEIMQLPQLDDNEFLRQLAQGIDTIPRKYHFIII